jgi:ribosomal protein L11 methyltransferase
MGLESGERKQDRVDPEVLNLSASEAFGSGAHPTTRLCLGMLHQYLKPEDRFLDVGTGTGILMIVADRLGAASVIGFDKYLPMAAEARDNLAANGVPANRSTIFVADSPGLLRSRFDIAAVNILPGVILALLKDMSIVLKPGGILLCSGMILGNTHFVEAGLAQAGFDLMHNDRIDLWVSIASQRQS